MGERRQNFQTIAWFVDTYNRKRLDLNPPYQRRSVWNQSFKDYFIDTILLGYPAPAIFLYEEIHTDGAAFYHVVDGKQRLTTILEFVENRFPVSEKAEKTTDRDKYFKQLDDTTKRAFWGYQFSVEYLPTDNEGIINNIFDRINRNTKRLSSQELRHAQFFGEFITAAEDLALWMTKVLPNGFPYIATGSKKQMKDVELVAQLLLLIEQGPKGHTTFQLDQAFSERDEAWAEKTSVKNRFREAVEYINRMSESSADFVGSRLKNQADFYSLVGAVDVLKNENELPAPGVGGTKLLAFVNSVGNEAARDQDTDVSSYYEAARSASSDIGPRNSRIDILKKILISEE